jgi:hypothetical protein
VPVSHHHLSLTSLSSPSSPSHPALPILPPRLARLAASLHRVFVPENISPDYYTFIYYRLIQRFVSSILYVLGTQSLLLGLGIKSHNLLGLGAALNWILKDALGKVARILWAGKMGRRFDCDAKRWRYRGTLLFAAGNGLEIVTYVYPAAFLLFATAGNCLKQVAMLTSSSTRNTLYNSFRAKGKSSNIGDITAKGEAQVAVVDLFGTAVGVLISKKIGLDVRKIISTWFFLQILDCYFNYKEIKSVIFKKLSFEKLWNVAEAHVAGGGSAEISTPNDVARSERIFRPPLHLCRSATAFGSLGRAALNPTELASLLDIFKGERYLLVVGEDIKNPRRSRNRRRQKARALRYLQRSTAGAEDDADDPRAAFFAANAREDCHIVLHSTATDHDVVKATLALACLRRELGAACSSDAGVCSTLLDENRRTGDALDLLKKARLEADERYELFLQGLDDRGWDREKFMFGAVSKRNVWEIEPSQSH